MLRDACDLSRGLMKNRKGLGFERSETLGGKVQRSRSRSGVASETPMDPRAAKPKDAPRAGLVGLLLAEKSWGAHS